MAGTIGFLSAAANIALQSILVKPKRAIGPFTAQVTLQETHSDVMELTDHPVEQGAAITDHAYIRPADLTIQCGWSNAPSPQNLIQSLTGAVTQTIAGVQSLITGNSASQVREIYEKLRVLQTQRIPFDVETAKRSYSNMLIRELSVTTNKETENSLIVTVTLRQVLIANTRTVQLSTPASAQAQPQKTQAPVNRGVQNLQPTSSYKGAGQ